jgi:hypothetical protein
MAEPGAGAPQGLPFTLGVPRGWYRMPEPPVPAPGAGAPASAAWAEEWVGGVAHAVSAAQGFTAEEDARLRATLAGAAARAAAQHRPGRVRLVYLGSPEVPRVRAWASLELYAGGGQTAEAFAAALLAPADGDGGVDVRDREVVPTQLAGLPAVTVHDLVAAPRASDAPRATAPARAVQHRFVATLFAPGDRILQLQISTPDLTAFADLPAVGRVIADSIVIGAPA